VCISLFSTLDYDNKTLDELFHADLTGLSKRNPLFLIKTIESATKPQLKCLFAEIEFRFSGNALPFQTMALCQSASSESALLFVMQSKDKETATKNESSFVAWINTHKLFRADVITDPRDSSGSIGVK